MAGTRTAPIVSDVTATSLGVTIHLIDSSGDLTTDYIVVPSLDLLDVQTFVTAYQAGTNASVWQVSVTQVFEGVKDVDNAVTAFRSSTENGINILFKDPVAQKKQTPRLVAPVASTMQENRDIPVLDAIMTALLAQYTTLLAGDYAVESLQYTTRRERKNNPKVNI